MTATVCTTDSAFRKEDIEYTCQALKALCHPVRLEILALIGTHAFSVQEIAELVGLPQSTTSQHLAVLRGRDILTTRKSANRVYYQIRDPRVLGFVEMMSEVFADKRRTRMRRLLPEVGGREMPWPSSHSKAESM